MIKKIGLSYCFVIMNIAVLIVSMVLPYDLLYGWNTTVTPFGITIVFIVPLLGIIGSVVSVKQKKWIALVLNILMLFLIPMIVILGSAFYA